jgi:hypothetical protein
MFVNLKFLILYTENVMFYMKNMIQVHIIYDSVVRIKTNPVSSR